MRKPYLLPLILALLVGLGLGSLGCARAKWEPGFKTELRDSIAFNLLIAGIDLEYAEPIAQCVVDKTERLVPSQKQMERYLAGEAETDIGEKVFKECACAIDPAAREHPTFCK